MNYAIRRTIGAILPIAWHAGAYSLGAWLLPTLLAGVLIAWLRVVKATLPLLGFTVLLVTLPLLTAGACFDETLATASAARWGLALCYGVGSLLLWQRHRLGAERAESVPATTIRAMLAVGCWRPCCFSRCTS